MTHDEKLQVISMREQAVFALVRKIDKVVEVEIEAKRNEDQYIFHTSQAEDFLTERDKCYALRDELNALIDEQFADIRRRKTR